MDEGCPLLDGSSDIEGFGLGSTDGKLVSDG